MPFDMNDTTDKRCHICEEPITGVFYHLAGNAICADCYLADKRRCEAMAAQTLKGDDHDTLRTAMIERLEGMAREAVRRRKKSHVGRDGGVAYLSAADDADALRRVIELLKEGEG